MTKKEEQFQQICKDNNIIIVGEYSGATKEINVLCQSCGEVVGRTPQIIKRTISRGAEVLCKECRYKSASGKRKKDEKDVMEHLSKNTKSVLSCKYENIDSHMRFVCDCGEEFERTFYQSNKSIERHGRNICTRCIRKKVPPPSNKLSVEKIQKICSKHGASLLSDSYSTNKEDVEVIGSCGHKFKRKWSRISHSISLYGEILCQHCGMRREREIVKTSAGENEVRDFIVSLGFEVLQSKRPRWANGKEIDLQINDTNIAIEYNGEYWHSEESGKDKKYHVQKEIDARKSGVNLIQIFETEWLYKKDIMKSILSAKLGKADVIRGRNTEIRSVSAGEAKTFFDNTHRQGGNGATNNSFGLYYKDELVACVTFRMPRFTKKYDYELYRFSTKLYTSITGGFQKLLKHAIRELDSISIVSYADLRFTNVNRNIYEKSGFTLNHISAPNYYYFKQGAGLMNRVGYQKHKLKDKLDSFDISKTEVENMRKNGFRRVWDCGSAVYELVKF